MITLAIWLVLLVVWAGVPLGAVLLASLAKQTRSVPLFVLSLLIGVVLCAFGIVATALLWRALGRV